MKNIISWFTSSNRWLHFLGGVVIGLLSNSVYCAALAGISAGGAMEFKDWQWGGKPDILDFLMTVLGTAAGFGLRLLAIKLFGL